MRGWLQLSFPCLEWLRLSDSERACSHCSLSLIWWSGLILSTQKACCQPLVLVWRSAPKCFPAVTPCLLLSAKLSWHVLKKPAEEMLAWVPLGWAGLLSMALKVSGSLLWNSRNILHLFPSSFQSPNQINHVGRDKRGVGRGACDVTSYSS